MIINRNYSSELDEDSIARNVLTKDLEKEVKIVFLIKI